MIRELVARFPSALPCRIRAGLALVMIENLDRGVGEAFSASLPPFVDLGWKWVEEGLHDLAELHRAFEGMHASLARLSDVQTVRAAQAVFLGAFCVLWEAYSEALDQGRISWRDLPGEELCEGGLDLWSEWADALCEVESSLPPQLQQSASAALAQLGGDAADRKSRIDRVTLLAMLQET